MGATRSRTPFTYEDYKRIPETTDRRYELMDGELCVVPAPTTLHQTVAQNLEYLLVQHARATRCGRVLHAPLDVVLGVGAQRDVVQPDIVYIAASRAAIVTIEEVVGAPDLVIEIVSPGSKTKDRGYKRALYERSKVREYWIVDPESSSVDVFVLGPTGFGPATTYSAGTELPCGVMPGLRVPLAAVFESWS
jgi:Uma2 family endonuclease